MRKVAVFFALGIIVSQLGYGRAQAAGPANPPTSVTASTKDGTGTATLKWIAPAGATGYKVRAMIGLVTVKTAVVAGGSSTSYTFTGLEYKIPYTLSVKAGDGTGYATNYTDASSTVTLQAAPPSPPEKPILAITQDGAIDATWVPPSETGGSNIVSYSVQLWKEGEKFGDPKLPTTTATSFDTRGDTTSQFTVTVQAVNAAGLVSLVSDPSESSVAKKIATATTTTPPTPSNGNGGGGGGNRRVKFSGFCGEWLVAQRQRDRRIYGADVDSRIERGVVQAGSAEHCVQLRLCATRRICVPTSGDLVEFQTEWAFAEEVNF